MNTFVKPVQPLNISLLIFEILFEIDILLKFTQSLKAPCEIAFVPLEIIISVFFGISPL